VRIDSETEKKNRKIVQSGEIFHWLDSFRKKHGRPLRVLHIGNVANNAYNNAKLLNKARLDCDVICYNYYHIMACPEWEDADFDGEITNQFFPDWRAINLNGFERPKWFVQGSLRWCLKYLETKRIDNFKKQDRCRRLLAHENRTVSGRTPKIKSTERHVFILSKFIRFCKSYWRIVYREDFRNQLEHKFQCLDKTFSGSGGIVKKLTVSAIMTAVGVVKIATYPLVMIFRRDPIIKNLEGVFKKAFPDRPDRLTWKDLLVHYRSSDGWRRIFKHYDIIHAYATDGIFPLLANVPYVAYEHGTIRNIPFEQTTQGRLCALTYKLADRVCITNADNIEAAKRLGLNNYTFVPHPINEEFLEPDEKSEGLRTSIRKRLGSDFIVLHPSRQHWEKQRHPDWEKGNDIFIRGLARFVKEVNPKAGAVFVEWGKSVSQSKKLLEELDIADRIMWILPQPNRNIVRYIYATDLLADQFYLGAFGSTMPKALVCGKPAMLYLNFDIHKWCFDEMPPVINAKTEEEVFKGLTKAYTNKEWISQLAEDGKIWYEKYHSNDIILNKLLAVYKDVLSERGE